MADAKTDSLKRKKTKRKNLRGLRLGNVTAAAAAGWIMGKKWMAMIVAVLLAMSVLSVCTAEDGLTVVELSDGMTQPEGGKVLVEGNTVTLTQPGEYLISGTLTDGMLVVDLANKGKVTVHLNNVTIHHENGPAIYIKNGDPRVTVSLADGSENTLSCGTELQFETDDEPNGVIFSRSDLTINGAGSLSVTAGAMDGIASKDDLKIEGGKLTVKAARHGLRGKDAVEILGGELDINAAKDGIKSTNEKDDELGYVSITGGTIHITCGDDPIQFVTVYRQENAKITVDMIR